jgi:hypothetical protein
LNLIYIRGKSVIKNFEHAMASVKTTVDLYAVPNELILWPQVWAGTKSVGKTDFECTNKDEQGFSLSIIVGVYLRWHVSLVVAATHPIPYGAHDELGRHDSFIALTHQGTILPQLPTKANNWKELVSQVGSNTNLAFYNCAFADPTSRFLSMTTRVRVFDDVAKTVKLIFSIEVFTVPYALSL